jgi:2-polyprenyl-3-methyl-5-hydroxy-6-metoxy-1,4-benzoquinol methylase
MDTYKTTIAAYDKLADVYQDNFMYLDLYDDTYDKFCNLIIKQNARIFEIGCGPGNITKYLLSKRPGFYIEAIDAAPNMVKLAKENNPAANFTIMDCREISKLNERFDAIICGFCMPYLSREDCNKLISDCSFLLHNGGILYFSTIEGDYNNSGYETDSSGEFKMYVYYHEESYLQEELEKNNFKLEDLTRKYYTKSDGTPSTHMIFIAKKK